MTDLLKRIASGKPQLGLWQALATPYTAEICARAGFDWLLFDGEHAPNTAQTLLAQLQAISAYPVAAVARLPLGEPVAIKQYLDLGFSTLLVPMVDSADHARAVVSASRFPPHGTRGVASATSRASGFGAMPDYLARAHERVSIIAQIESAAALATIDEIAAVDGIDALFLGPADLAASLGHLGNPQHPKVQAAIDHAKARIDAAGKPAGIFALSADDAIARMGQGFAFLSIGTDIGLLTRGSSALLNSLRN
ncbi:HpcH/HpaI aldolase/citrate lyase family protein [Novosphingobium sp.]|uniref:HpcH/HpaI aldolase family protein n=1 Tax=Novosphingobium sp. TaxID=1874826 RepID=UPI003568F293